MAQPRGKLDVKTRKELVLLRDPAIASPANDRGKEILGEV